MTSQQYANILEDNSDIDKIINWGSAINQNDYDLILWPHHKYEMLPLAGRMFI